MFLCITINCGATKHGYGVVCYNTTNEICQYIIEVLVRGRMRFVNIPPKWYFLRYIQEMKRGPKKDVALTRHLGDQSALINQGTLICPDLPCLR